MQNESRSNIIQAINTPLGFFALSLLIVEGFLAISLIFTKEPKKDDFNFWGMIIGAGLFFIVVLLVWILVWKKPKHLTLEGKHYSEIEKEKIKATKSYSEVELPGLTTTGLFEATKNNNEFNPKNQTS